MRKIIQGKVYDTDTAQRISGDIFQKKTGEFFSEEEGRIVPLGAIEAQKRLRELMSRDEFERFFGICKVLDKVALNTQINHTTMRRLKMGASKRGETLGQYIEYLSGLV